MEERRRWEVIGEKKERRQGRKAKSRVEREREVQKNEWIEWRRE